MHIMVHVLVTKFEACSLIPRLPNPFLHVTLKTWVLEQPEEDMTMDSAPITMRTRGYSPESFPIVYSNLHAYTITISKTPNYGH